VAGRLRRAEATTTAAALDTAAAELPHLAAATARLAQQWTPRKDGKCLACNGGQHAACEGVDTADGGPCQCWDQSHMLDGAPGPLVADVPYVVDTHRACREAAARVCPRCAEKLAAVTQ